jgi:hypothetical protein
MPRDPELLAHLEWLGFLQPVGLVVSPFALINAHAHVDRNVFDLQQRFLKHVHLTQRIGADEPIPTIIDLSHLLRDVFSWRPTDLIGGNDLPPSLEVALPDYQETLRPTFAVPEARPGDDGAAAWIMLIQNLPTGADMDRAPPQDGPGWHASPQARFERLLRETHIPIGLLSNGTSLRLVYAPRGESSGHVTFPVRAMTETAGRPILAALHMLLSEERLFSVREKQRLPAILAESRRFQNTVSTKLAGQVLEALYELLRGFQAADEQRHGDLLRDVLNRNPDDVYAGLLTVLLRLVFLLYAEDRGLTPSGGVFVNHYSVAGLFEKLRADAGRYPDTMDQRYGAWARLLTLFRLVHDGGAHPELKMPARKGHLFAPDRYPFLSGSSQLSVVSSQSSELATDNYCAPRPRRCDLPRPRKAAHPQRRAARLQRPGSGTHRLRLRDDDGLPPGEGGIFRSHLAQLIEVQVARRRFPVEFHFRMGVHVGPVFRFWDWGRGGQEQPDTVVEKREGYGRTEVGDWNYIGEGINGGQRVLAAVGKETDDVIFISGSVKQQLTARDDGTLPCRQILNSLLNRGRKADKHNRFWRVYEVNHAALIGPTMPHTALS